jgi:NAD(P)-dependent dehydrogenase (short-subunit alcohol dehydrogenase family)
MSPKNKIAVVTGANRGIGFETCRQLARRGMKVILAARDEARGRAAVDDLRREGLDVGFGSLDVADPESVGAFAGFVQKEHGRVDVLVNNAGIMLEKHDSGFPTVFKARIETLRETMETNVYGALRVVQALRPLLPDRGDGARIINVSSGMGQLTDMNGGYAGYRLSKAGLNALTRILADELKGTAIRVNSICPGWVKTGMGGEGAHRSTEQGADTIVWLATEPAIPTGGFFRDRKAIPW